MVSKPVAGVEGQSTLQRQLLVDSRFCLGLPRGQEYSSRILVHGILTYAASEGSRRPQAPGPECPRVFGAAVAPAPGHNPPRHSLPDYSSCGALALKLTLRSHCLGPHSGSVADFLVTFTRGLLSLTLSNPNADDSA